MKPTITGNDELLLPNGKMYSSFYIASAIANTNTSTNRPSDYQTTSLNN